MTDEQVKRSLSQQQWDFLEGEFLSSSISGALQHSSTYATEKVKDREKVRREIRNVLCELAERYSTKVTEVDHVKNIKELACRVKKKQCGPFLKDGELRFPVAAKALNLYLKFLWCFGKITIPPPHCPFDRGEIQGLLGFKEDDWTKVVDVDVYRKWVRKAEELRKAEDLRDERDANNPRSLAEWELDAWSRAQPEGKAGCPRTEP